MIQENEVQIVPPPPICWKLESFRGLRSLGPRQGPLWRAPGPHPYEARADTRTDFSAHPLFCCCKSWIRHCTHPPLLVQVACPPPPPWRGMPGTPLISILSFNKALPRNNLDKAKSGPEMSFILIAINWADTNLQTYRHLYLCFVS